MVCNCLNLKIHSMIKVSFTFEDLHYRLTKFESTREELLLSTSASLIPKLHRRNSYQLKFHPLIF